MRKIVVWVLISITFILIGWFANVAYRLPKSSSNPIAQIKPTPLLKYSIENLATTSIPSSKIEIGDLISQTNDYSTYKYHMEFSPDLSKNLKTVSGIINIPKGVGPFPTVVMFRGFVDQKTYVMGTGTQPSAKVFAKNGYITIAPDFFGFGESDKESNDIFETRFQTWTTAVTTLKSLSTIEKWDKNNVFIWGHSNGGQIALTTLEITGATYPTVLWAPVTMPFPGSILYFTYEYDDQGKYIVEHLSDFNSIYDSSKFSLTNYIDRIKAPIQLNQGTLDSEIPYFLNDSFTKQLKEATISATYIKYSGNDHNMRPNWDQAVENAMSFYKSHLLK